MSRVNGLLFEIDKKINLQTTGPSAFLSSGGANTILASVFIPANTFAVNDVIQIEHMNQKSGATAILTWYYYYNTANNLVGATQIAQRSESAANIASPGMRKLAIRSTTNNTYVMGSTANFYTDFQTITSASSTLSLNWTVDSYILLTGTYSSDTVRNLYLKITN